LAGVSRAIDLIPQTTSRVSDRQPTTKGQTRVPPNEKVNVIRHDYVTTNRDIMRSRSACRVIPKDSSESMQVVDLLPMSCAECDEIKRRSRINTVDPMRPIFSHDLL
jgi:hypothetical protein